MDKQKCRGSPSLRLLAPPPPKLPRPKNLKTSFLDQVRVTPNALCRWLVRGRNRCIRCEPVLGSVRGGIRGSEKLTPVSRWMRRAFRSGPAQRLQSKTARRSDLEKNETHDARGVKQANPDAAQRIVDRRPPSHTSGFRFVWKIFTGPRWLRVSHWSVVVSVTRGPHCVHLTLSASTHSCTPPLPSLLTFHTVTVGWTTQLTGSLGHMTAVRAT